MPKVQVSAKKVGKEVKVSLGRDYRIKLAEDPTRLFKVGQVVLDDLTGEVATVVNIVAIENLKDRDGNIVVYEDWKGNWIQVTSRCKPNSDGSVWDDGWRYEWEVTHVEKISVK